MTEQPTADPFELAAEADKIDVEPDDDETKVVDLIPGGLDVERGPETDELAEDD